MSKTDRTWEEQQKFDADVKRAEEIFVSLLDAANNHAGSHRVTTETRGEEVAIIVRPDPEDPNFEHEELVVSREVAQEILRYDP